MCLFIVFYCCFFVGFIKVEKNGCFFYVELNLSSERVFFFDIICEYMNEFL